MQKWEGGRRAEGRGKWEWGAGVGGGGGGRAGRQDRKSQVEGAQVGKEKAGGSGCREEERIRWRVVELIPKTTGSMASAD